MAEKKTAAVVEEKKAAAAPPSSNPTSSLRMRPTVVSRKPAATLTAKTSTAVPKLTTTTRPKPAPLSSNIPLKVTETTKSILIPTTKLDVNENRKKIDPKTKAPVAAAVNLRDEDVAEAGKENREIIVANNNSAVAVVAPKITAVPADGSHKRQKTCEILDTAEEHSWDDLDADDLDDPVMVSEYVVEIFEYLKVLEVSSSVCGRILILMPKVKMMPDPDYMSQQKELQWRMRSILMDWLVEVHYKFKLLPETLFLTANIIDRFLSVKVNFIPLHPSPPPYFLPKVVSLTKLQLVGITSMFIAAKYEEVFAPSISQFVFIADGGYTTEEIVKAERYVLSMLQFNLQYPNPLNFLRRCSKADNYDIQTRTLAKYLMEITLIDHVFLDIVPSLISSSGIFLARKILERSEWVRLRLPSSQLLLGC